MSEAVYASTRKAKREAGPKTIQSRFSLRSYGLPIFTSPWSTRIEASRYFDAESLAIKAIASCTVVMNWAGKMMVEFFSTEISAMVCRVRS
jgi:hypothetical protein